MDTFFRAQRNQLLNKEVNDSLLPACFCTLVGWREENYAVGRGCLAAGERLFELERAATPILGVRQYGVHINGMVEDLATNTTSLWLQVRAKNKPTFPGKLGKLANGS